MSEAFYNENEPYAAQWLENLEREGHIAPGKVDARSIVDIKPKDLEGFRQAHFFAGLGGWSHALRLAGWPDDGPQVWSGSCPCQPFSTAGRRKGFADERHLWPEWFRLIRKCRPGVVFGEQIAGTDGLRWLDLVFADMEGAGYACWATDTCAAGVGAPHLRQRLYFVAYASGERLRRPSVPQSHLEQDSVQSAQRGPGSGQADGRARVRGRDVVSGSFGLADSGDQRRNRIDSSVQPGGSHQADPETDGHSTTRELGDARSQGGGGHAGAVPRTEAKSKREGRIARGVAHEPESASDALELGDASGARSPVGPGPEERFGAVRYEGPSPAETGATRGFWRDAEWWVCRDGKARPTESSYVKMVDGLSAGMGRLRPALSAEEEEEVDGKKSRGHSVEEMQTMQQEDGASTLQRASGGSRRVSPSGVLQSRVHDDMDGRKNQKSDSQKQSPTVSQKGRIGVRNVRAHAHSIVRASQEPQPVGQRSAQFADVVRTLPQALSLSELYGDRRTTSALRILQASIFQAGVVRDPRHSVQAVWASLGEKAKARIEMDFDAARWVLVEPFPLALDAPARVGRLKAYGNAIVPQQAALLIRAVMPLIGLKSAG